MPYALAADSLKDVTTFQAKEGVSLYETLRDCENTVIYPFCLLSNDLDLTMYERVHRALWIIRASDEVCLGLLMTLFSPMNDVLPVIPNPTDSDTVAMAAMTVVGSSFATWEPPLYCASLEFW